MSNRKLARRASILAAAVAGLGLWAGAANAGVVYWGGAGADVNFNTLANWELGALPTNDLTTDIMGFDNASYTRQPTMNVTRSLNGLQIDSTSTAAVTLTATNLLSLGGSGINIANGAGIFTLAGTAGVDIAATQTWYNADNDTAVIGKVTYTNLLTLGSGTWNINAAGAGTGGLKVDGSTAWLQVGAANPLGASGNALTLNSGRISSDGTTARSLTNNPLFITGNVTFGDVAKNGALTFDYATAPTVTIDGARTIDVLSAVNFTGRVAGINTPSLTVRGPGLLTLKNTAAAGNNSNFGNLTVGDGSTFSGNLVGGNVLLNEGSTANILQTSSTLRVRYGGSVTTGSNGPNLDSLNVSLAIEAGGSFGANPAQRFGTAYGNTLSLASMASISSTGNGIFVYDSATLPSKGVLLLPYGGNKYLSIGAGTGTQNYPALSGTMVFGGGGAIEVKPSGGTKFTLSDTAGEARTIAFNASGGRFSDFSTNGTTLNANLTVAGSGNTGLGGLLGANAAGSLGAVTESGSRSLTVAMAPTGVVRINPGSTFTGGTFINSGALAIDVTATGRAINSGSTGITLNGGALRVGKSGGGDKDITDPIAVNSASAIEFFITGDSQDARLMLTGGITGSSPLTVRARGGSQATMGIIGGNNSLFTGGFNLEFSGGSTGIGFASAASLGGGGNGSIVVPAGVMFATGTLGAAYTPTVSDAAKFALAANGETLLQGRYYPSGVNLNTLGWDVRISGNNGYTLAGTWTPFASTYKLAPTFRGENITIDASNMFTDGGGSRNLDIRTGAVAPGSDTVTNNTGIQIRNSQNYTGTTVISGTVKNALMGGGVGGATLTLTNNAGTSSGDLSGTTGLTLDVGSTLNLTGLNGAQYGRITAANVPIIVRGGSALTIGDTTAANNNGVNNRIAYNPGGGNNGADLTLGGTSGGATLTQRFAGSSNSSSQTLDALTIAAGSSTINTSGITAATPGSLDLIFTGGASVTRNAGGVVVVSPPSASNITGQATLGSPTITGVSDTSRVTVGQNLSIAGASFDPSSGNGIWGVVLSKTANTITMSQNATANTVANAAITYPYGYAQFTGAPTGPVVGAGGRAIVVGALLSQGEGRVVPVAAAGGYLGAPTLDVKNLNAGSLTFTMNAGENVFVTQSDAHNGGDNTTVSVSDLSINSFTACTRTLTVNFDNPNRIWTVESGMITWSKNAVTMTIGGSPNFGEIRTGNGQDLIFNASPGTIDVYSKIGQQDMGGGTFATRALTVGSGTVQLRNAANQIGDVYVNAGTLTSTAQGALGGAGTISLFGGTLTFSTAIQTVASNKPIIVGPQGGTINAGGNGDPSDVLNGAVTLNGTLTAAGSGGGLGSATPQTLTLAGNISGAGMINCQPNIGSNRTFMLALTGSGSTFTGGVIAGQSGGAGSIYLAIGEAASLGTGPLVITTGGTSAVYLDTTAVSSQNYTNDIVFNNASAPIVYRSLGPGLSTAGGATTTLSGRLMGTGGLTFQGYATSSTAVGELVLAGTVSLSGTPATLNLGSAANTQNFVNGQGGLTLGVNRGTGNQAVDLTGAGTYATDGALGFVRFSGAQSFIPGAVGPGYLSAIRKAGGGQDGRFGYLVTATGAGTTYQLPEGKSFLIGSLGSGTQQYGTLGVSSNTGSGSNTATLLGGPKAAAGQTLAGMPGGDVNIHANAAGDSQSLNLFARHAGDTLILGDGSNPVVFTPTWGDSGATSAITLMQKRTGTTTLKKVGDGILEVIEAEYTHTDGVSARTAFLWEVNDGTLLYEDDDTGLPDFQSFTVNAGGTLGGAGKIKTVALSVAIGGIVSPGRSIERLDVIGTVDIDGTYTADVTHGASPMDADMLYVTGNLTLDTSTSVLDLPGTNTYNASTSYTIATYTGTLTGTFFSAPNLPSTHVIDYGNGSNDVIQLVPIPEPSTFVPLAILGLTGFFSRRRRG
jgi:hypothetical protein